MDPKTQRRKELIEKRQQLDPHFVEATSKKIERHFLSLEEFALADRLGLYSAFQNEVQTASLFAKAHALRKEVFYPAVDLTTRKIDFFRVRSLKELAPGFAGILEPSRREHPLSNINFLNLVVVPGVGFDKKGNRLGFGQGFYDQLLEKFQGKRVAFAYEFQICDSLPTGLRDQRVDCIVTEERILRII